MPFITLWVESRIKMKHTDYTKGYEPGPYTNKVTVWLRRLGEDEGQTFTAFTPVFCNNVGILEDTIPAHLSQKVTVRDMGMHNYEIHADECLYYAQVLV